MRRRFTIAGAAAGVMLAGALAAAQNEAAKPLPYAAVHDPEFIRAAEASFVHDEDRVIGLMAGDAAKAYPAGILSQHGLVQDRSPKGPIAVTW